MVRRADAVVVGAGVIGLTSAVCLAEAGLSVACWSAEAPRRTTSNVAGALWANSPLAADGDRLTGWALCSLAAFGELAGVPHSGVRLATGMVAWHETAASPPPQTFPGVALRAPARVPEGYAGAFELDAPLIDMALYLDYLESRLRALDTKVELRRVSSLEEAAAAAPLVVNCTGLGARELVHDAALEGVRGQHVVVGNPGVEKFFLDDRSAAEWTCWFPHRDRVVLGGIAQPGLADGRPDPAVAERIRARCAALEPRFADAPVLAHLVGLRPARPEVRLEEGTALGAARCVHNYGHGRSGVSLSWGCAREVVDLVLAGAGAR